MLDAAWAKQAKLSEAHQTQGPRRLGASLDQQVSHSWGSGTVPVNRLGSLFFGKFILDLRGQSVTDRGPCSRRSIIYTILREKCQNYDPGKTSPSLRTRVNRGRDLNFQ